MSRLLEKVSCVFVPQNSEVHHTNCMVAPSSSSNTQVTFIYTFFSCKTRHLMDHIGSEFVQVTKRNPRQVTRFVYLACSESILKSLRTGLPISYTLQHPRLTFLQTILNGNLVSKQISVMPRTDHLSSPS